jgi:hypothetical protein
MRNRRASRDCSHIPYQFSPSTSGPASFADRECKRISRSFADRNSGNIFPGFFVGTSPCDVPAAQRTPLCQRFFFVFPIPSVCFTTNDFMRAYSFRTPLAKSRGPYSNSTTKQKVKTMKRTNQKSPRSSAMTKSSRCGCCDQWPHTIQHLEWMVKLPSYLTMRVPLLDLGEQDRA